MPGGPPATARRGRVPLQGKTSGSHVDLSHLVPTKEGCNSANVFKSKTSTSCLAKGQPQPLPSKVPPTTPPPASYQWC